MKKIALFFILSFSTIIVLKAYDNYLMISCPSYLSYKSYKKFNINKNEMYWKLEGTGNNSVGIVTWGKITIYSQNFTVLDNKNITCYGSNPGGVLSGTFLTGNTNIYEAKLEVTHDRYYDSDDKKSYHYRTSATIQW